MFIVWFVYLNLIARAISTPTVTSDDYTPIEIEPEYKKMHPDNIKHAITRSCLRKRNLSLEEANRVVDKYAARGTLLYFYKCDFCCSHHMTSKPLRPNKSVSVV